MQYLRSLSILQKVKFYCRIIFKKLLNPRSVVYINTFDKVHSRKKSIDYNVILNAPDHLNWHIRIQTSCPTINYLGIRDEHFNYKNTFFSSDRFRDPRFCSRGVFSDTEKVIYSLDKGVTIGNYGIVYDYETKFYIQESIKQYFLPHYFFFYRANQFPPLKKIDGVGLLLAHPGSDGGFYHFIFESLGRLWFAERLGVNFDFYLIPGPILEWKIKWLNFFEIDLRKVIWLDHNSHVQLKQLVFTSPLFPDTKPNKILYEYFQKKAKPFFTPDVLKFPKVIWLTRKRKSVRNVQWEDEFLSRFPTATAIDLENESLSNAINLFRNAELIIAPHGAALCNLIFCKPKTKVIELFSENAIQPVYQRLSQIAGLDYYPFEVSFIGINEKDLRDLETLIHKIYVNQMAI